MSTHSQSLRKLHIRSALCDRLKIAYPIVQAPIGSATCPALAAAVSNAGGLGTLAVSWQKPENIRSMIRETKKLTQGPFAVNLVLAQSPGERLQICLEEGVPIVWFSWGDPSAFIESVRDRGTLVMQTAGSVGEAKRALEWRADVIVAQGWEAGGHVCGEIGSLALIPRIVDTVQPTPVVAAGGIGDGRGIAAVLALGAAGAALGTRFLATVEAAVAPVYKEAIVRASESDTVYTTLFDVGWPGAPHRVLKNSTTELGSMAESGGPRTGEGETIGAFRDGSPVLRYSDVIPLPGMSGDLTAMALYAGQSVGLVSRIQPATELTHELAQTAAQTLQRLSSASA